MSKEAPYIAVDFDVLEKVSPAGAACGLTGEQVFMGLGKLWLYCWREKTEHVTTTHILGFFYGVNACEALLTFGFIAATPEGWRVRGADRWLFIQRARSENGKANVGNLKRGTKPGPGKPPAPPSDSPAPPRDPPGTPPGSAPALTASSVKRPTSNDVKEDLPSEPESHPIQAIWNAKRKPPLPEWTATKGKRLTHADARLLERPDPEFWRDVMTRIDRSDFLSGRKTDFKATPDWIINPSNLTKVLEGNYDGNGPPGKGPIDAATQSHGQTGWVSDF